MNSREAQPLIRHVLKAVTCRTDTARHSVPFDVAHFHPWAPTISRTIRKLRRSGMHPLVNKLIQLALPYGGFFIENAGLFWVCWKNSSILLGLYPNRIAVNNSRTDRSFKLDVTFGRESCRSFCRLYLRHLHHQMRPLFA